MWPTFRNGNIVGFVTQTRVVNCALVKGHQACPPLPYISESASSVPRLTHVTASSLSLSFFSQRKLQDMRDFGCPARNQLCYDNISRHHTLHTMVSCNMLCSGPRLGPTLCSHHLETTLPPVAMRVPYSFPLPSCRLRGTHAHVNQVSYSCQLATEFLIMRCQVQAENLKQGDHGVT